MGHARIRWIIDMKTTAKDNSSKSKDCFPRCKDCLVYEIYSFIYFLLNEYFVWVITD
jgi:hypothetical protein